MKVTIQDSRTSVTVEPRDFRVTVSGARGPQGDAGIGIAAGGVEGQILAKASATDYDTEWIDNFAPNVEVYVKNSSGSPMTKGQIVYISGADGTNPTISLAIATSEMGSSKTIGWLKQDLAQGEFGYVITEGLLEGINTNSAGAAGDPVWLSPTTAGGVVYGLASKPSAPNHLVFLGYVLRKQTNNGKVYVKVQNGFELGELHDVYNGTKTTPVSADALLLRDSADNNLWKRLTWTNALGGVKSHMDTFKSVAGGYASLDGSGKVPSSELPSYVDDVIEVANYAALPVTGETGKIYVTLDTNKCYRWSGSVYIQVAQGVDTLTTTGTSGPATLVGSTLNIPQYQGALTNPVTGTGTAGQVAYFNGTSAVTGSNNLFWDAANGRLGIGTTTSSGRLTVQGSGTTNATKAFVVNNATPTAIFEVLDNGRINQTIPGTTNNTIFGTGAGASASLTGGENSFFGQSAGFNNTTGVNNSFFGQGAGQSNTTGGNNSFFGLQAGQSNTTGGSNSFFGLSAGRSNTTGNSNTFFGLSAGRNNTTGNSNTFFGLNAGRYIADGVTSLTDANNSVFLGFDTRAAADSQTNQIAIGYQAIGNGSNTATLGNTSITATYLRGNINYTDGGNFVIGTTTGTKIGTATSQKIGLWNATPIVQPTTAVAAATRVGGAGNTVTDTDTFDGYTIAQLVKALRNMGALA